MWAVGKGRSKLHLFDLAKSPKFPRSAQIHMNTEGYAKEKQQKRA